MPPMAPGDAPRQSPAQDRIHSLEDPQLHGAECCTGGHRAPPHTASSSLLSLLSCLRAI